MFRQLFYSLRRGVREKQSRPNFETRIRVALISFDGDNILIHPSIQVAWAYQSRLDEGRVKARHGNQ